MTAQPSFSAVRRTALVACAAMALAAWVLAPAATAQPALPIQLDVDHAAFRWSADSTLVEAYLAVGAAGLDYVQDPDGYRASLDVVMAMRPAASPAAPASAARAAVFQDTLALTFVVPDTTRLREGQFFVQQTRWAVPSGEYQLDVTVPAAPGRPEVRLQQDVLAPAFAADGQARLSTLALASSIRRSDQVRDPFYKNGLAIRPNPNALYGEGLEKVSYYAEAYGLDEAAGDDQYTVFSYIAAANLPQPIEGLQQRKRRAARSVDVLVGQFDVSALPSGAYYLRIALLDRDNAALAEGSRKFFVVNPSVRAAIALSDVSAELRGSTLPGHERGGTGRTAQPRPRRRDGHRAARDQGAPDLEEPSVTYLPSRFWSAATTIRRLRSTRRAATSTSASSTSTSATGALSRTATRPTRGASCSKYGQSRRTSIWVGRQASEHEVWGYDNIPGEGSATFVFADEQGFGDYAPDPLDGDGRGLDAGLAAPLSQN